MDTLERILALAKEVYSSDRAFEEDLGVPSKTIYDWKRRKSKSYLEILPLISKLLNVTTDYLFGLEDDDLGDDEFDVLAASSESPINTLTDDQQKHIKNLMRLYLEKNKK